MSFDTDFNYSAALAEIATRLTANGEAVTAVNAKIATLNAMVGYADLVAAELATLNEQKNRIDNDIAALQAVQTEIGVVQALSAEDKETIHYIYTVLTPNRQEFMLRVLFNHVAALVDPDVVALIADTTNSSEGKVILANLIYARYPIYGQYIVALVSLYRFM